MSSSKQQTSLEHLPLEDSWKALRGKPLRRRVVEKALTAPTVEPVIKWTLRFHDDAKRPVNTPAVLMASTLIAGPE